MQCSMCKGVWIQAAAIIAVGSAIGVADAFWFRPIQLTREAPPPLNLDVKPPVVPLKPVEPANTAPSAAANPVAAPATPSVPQVAAPSTGAFVFTPKDKLPAGHITIEEAKSLFDQGAVFVDARKMEPYAAGHVANAYRLELAMFSGGDPAILAMIPRSSIVVSYCSGGHCDESEAVARMLDGSGYKKVYVMHDGFPGWQAKGFPSETGKGIEQ